MCLIALAHRASPLFPLVLAANRDEDYERPTRDAHAWEDAPDVVGGTDALYGGAWLAARRGGRFAAVTNLRGAARRARSRGSLVRDFVTGELAPALYGEAIAKVAGEYAGFHLLAGDVGGDILYIAPEGQRVLSDGVHAFSNAPYGEQWPKTGVAAEALQHALRLGDSGPLIDELLQFLSTRRGTGSPESEVFLAGDRYGTRSSTVVVATRSEIVFAEQSYARGGVAQGERRLFRFLG